MKIEKNSESALDAARRRWKEAQENLVDLEKKEAELRLMEDRKRDELDIARMETAVARKDVDIFEYNLNAAIANLNIAKSRQMVGYIQGRKNVIAAESFVEAAQKQCVDRKAILATREAAEKVADMEYSMATKAYVDFASVLVRADDELISATKAMKDLENQIERTVSSSIPNCNFLILIFSLF